MWVVVPIISERICRGVCPFEKSVPLWADTPVEKAISGGIQTDLFYRCKYSMRYDRLHSSQEKQGSAA